jgi:hypothetical protein
MYTTSTLGSGQESLTPQDADRCPLTRASTMAGERVSDQFENDAAYDDVAAPASLA